MPFDQDMQDFGSFDVDLADASLWVFKKRPAPEQQNTFTASSVLMGEELREELRKIVGRYQESCTLAEEYGLLAQVNEDGFLAADRENSIFSDLQGLIDRPLEECLARKVKQLNNAAGYVFRLEHNALVLYCVKKAGADWATRKKKGLMSVLFDQAEMEIVDTPSFSIARIFDFFVIGSSIFITNKAAFESLLSHKETYQGAYLALKQEPGFSAAIASFQIFDQFIGNNATHLRRMAVIKVRGYYNNPDYMARLRQINQLRNWGIQFDAQDRIVPTADKMRDILHILLDHRLRSELSENDYDVPATTPVQSQA